MNTELQQLELEVSKSKKNVYVMLVIGILLSLIFGGIITDSITNSDYVTYGGESEAFWGGLLSAICYGVPFIPFARALSKRKKLTDKYDSLKKQSTATNYNKSQAAQAVVKADDKEYVSSDVPKTEELKKAETKETGSSSVKEQLKELKSLYDEKLISKAVYDQKQKDIIDKM